MVFCKYLDNKQWVWLAIDAVTREIVGVYVGARNEEGAQGLWESLPPVSSPMCSRLHRFLDCLLLSSTKQ